MSDAAVRNFTVGQQLAISMIGFTTAILSDRTVGHIDPDQRRVNRVVAELLCRRGYVVMDGDGNCRLSADGMKVHQALFPHLHDEVFMAEHPSWREQ